jgi:hypothetical protein
MQSDHEKYELESSSIFMLTEINMVSSYTMKEQMTRNNSNAPWA